MGWEFLIVQESNSKTTEGEGTTPPVAMDTESVATPTSKEGGSKDEKAESGGGSGGGGGSAPSGNKDSTAETEKAAESAEKKEPEPNFQLLSNPARVLPQQVNLSGVKSF